MRCYSKDRLKIIVEPKCHQDIKDVAAVLKREIIEQNLKLSIDAAGLLSAFVAECENIK